MTSKERYLNMLKGELCDIVPRTPILMQFAAEYIGSDYGAFASDYKVLVESNIKCAQDFGMDQVSCISDPYRETHGFGGEIKYVEDGVPRCTAPLESTKDLSVLAVPDPDVSERMLDRVRAASEFSSRGEYSVLGWLEGPAAEAGDLRGLTNLMMDLMDDEPYACDLMDLTLENGIAFARAQIDAGCDTIGIGDALVSQVSADIYERLVLPREKKLVDAIHEMGAFVKLHICGNITHLLPGIADLGLDIIDVDHLVDVITVREMLGNVAIAGNIDPAEGVFRGTPESIRETMLKIYEQVGNPFLVNAGCEIPSGTPSENLKALCEPIAWSEQG